MAVEHATFADTHLSEEGHTESRPRCVINKARKMSNKF